MSLVRRRATSGALSCLVPVGRGRCHCQLIACSSRDSRSAARGPVRVVATLADGHQFTRFFQLPLSRGRATDRNPRYRRPGAVFNDEIGENIVGQSFRGIVSRFGAPLKTFSGRSGARCAYYDVVGYPTGWVFCFRHGVMIDAAGNRAPPAGVH